MSSAEALAFASALFDGVPEGLHTHLWTRQDKRSWWVPLGDNGAERVAAQAASLSRRKSDVYVSVSVVATPGKEFTRVTSDASAGIVGLWADVDIADPDVHKKFNLPPDEDSAHAILQASGVEPSIVIHSGHGLQAWWLFKEFWEFENEAARRSGAELAQRWNSTLRIRAAERNWVLDSTFDLARVMRMPGTLNHKQVPAVPVRLLHDSGKRYSAEDFEDFLVDDSVLADRGISPVRAYVTSDLSLSEAAQPHFEKFEALRANDDLFGKTWDRARRDFKDQSGSSYDLSLATLAANAGWSDQEIADLIIAHRRKHNDNVAKGLRPDYLKRTIGKARDTTAREIAAEQMDDTVQQMEEVKSSGDDEAVRDARRATLDSISQQVGLEVVHFVKYTSEPPTYRMITPTQSVDLGQVESVLDWGRFRASVAAATDRMIPRFKQPAWDRVAQAILHTAEHQDVGMEATQQGQIYVWVSEYLLARPPTDDAEQATTTEYPFKSQGATYIFGAAFRTWLWISRGERVSARELGKLLRLHGCTPSKVNVDLDGSRTSRSAWRLPDGGSQ